MATTKKKKTTAKDPGTSMVNVEAEMAEQQALIKSRIQRPTGSKVSIRDKQFTIPELGTSDTFHCVIIEFAARNDFFEGRYDPNAIVPPKCAAAGIGLHNSLIPFPEVPAKESKECNGCPNIEWGSDGKGKACKNTYMLAVVPPDGDSECPIYTLSVPPTSLGNFDSYVAKLDAIGQLPIKAVTEITFDTSQTYPKLKFNIREAEGVNEDFAMHWGRRKEAIDIITAAPDFTRSSKPSAKKTRSK